MDYTETTRIWFQMTRPAENKVNLKIRVFENGLLEFEENIHETIHAPELITELLEKCGFTVLKCADQLPDNSEYHGTTWFLIAQKQR